MWKLDKLSHKNLQCSEGTTNTSTVVKGQTEITSKANSTDLNKLASQSATTGDHVTSTTEECKETGIIAKPPTHAITVPGQTDQSGCVPPNKPLQPALHVATKIEENSQKSSLVENLKPLNTAGECTSQTNSEAIVKRAVTCPEDGLVLNQYPWKHELTVRLDRIQPLEINIWSKKV